MRGYIAESFDTARSSASYLLEEEIIQLPDVVTSLLHAQEAGSLQQECSAFLVCGLQSTVTALHSTQKQVAELSADAAVAKFLATYRDPVRRWFNKRAQRLLAWIGTLLQASWTRKKMT